MPLQKPAPAAPDAETERLARLHSGRGEHVTLINFRRPPAEATTAQHTVGPHQVAPEPWTRPALTPEQRMALKQLD